MQSKPRTSERRQKNGLGAEYTEAVEIIPAEPDLKLI
jgi:hypothetical protein